MSRLTFGRMPKTAFSLILELLDFSELEPSYILSLRLISKSVDECMYEIWYSKTNQLWAKEAKLRNQKIEYISEGKEREFLKKLDDIEERMEEEYEKCNTVAATLEFHTWGEPPDYVYRIGEACLEITCQIPLRTPF